jgi:hypothetical protein
LLGQNKAREVSDGLFFSDYGGFIFFICTDFDTLGGNWSNELLLKTFVIACHEMFLPYGFPCQLCGHNAISYVFPWSLQALFEAFAQGYLISVSLQK